MKNKGTFDILGVKGKNVIVYVEDGVVRYLEKYSFDDYSVAKGYLEGHKVELDNFVTELKALEQKQIEDAESEKLAREKTLAEEKVENEKKKKARLERFKTFVIDFLVAALLLTGGHFAAKGISASIKDRESKKPSTSQNGDLDPTNTTEPTQTTEPTVSTEPVLPIGEDIENIINYEEMYNTENFEKIVAEFAKPYVDNNLSLTTEDLTKFVSIMLIDRLAEENPELSHELFSTQTVEEYLNDAAKTIGVTYMYDHTRWEADGNTDNFIWVSTAIPEGDPQKEAMELLEDYVRRIAKATKAENAQEEVNKITAELIEELTSPDGKLNALDDGVEFAAQVYFALINNSIGRNYLTQEHRDYFNVRASAEQNVSNIFIVYEGCVIGEVKTRKLG